MFVFSVRLRAIAVCHEGAKEGIDRAKTARSRALYAFSGVEECLPLRSLSTGPPAAQTRNELCLSHCRL
uniref:Uncharacterized protein n=1 Tax=Panagrellus redivivus TaxID=6233 RepID=A0A7E4ZUE8_PANRE